jgi:hypothetical protein
MQGTYPDGGKMMNMKAMAKTACLLIAVHLLALNAITSYAQMPPSEAVAARYKGLHRAAHTGNIKSLQDLISQGANLEERDGFGRTPMHVAAFASHEEAVKLLAAAGADVNALENQAYDIVTISAVANDVDMLDMALTAGGNAANITSPYDGTALIAAAHLGHHEVVNRLITAGAPLDHVNNLDWTALIEVVVLGDGGENHIKSLKALLDGGADRTIGDGNGVTPLQHAKSRGFADMAALLE